MRNGIDEDMTIDGPSLLAALRESAAHADAESGVGGVGDLWRPQPSDANAVVIRRSRQRLTGPAIALLLVTGMIGALIGFYAFTALHDSVASDPSFEGGAVGFEVSTDD